MRTLAVAVIVGCLASGCTAIRGRIHVFPRCADGLPPEILTDPACPPDSICGYSCLPGRWTPGVDDDAVSDATSKWSVKPTVCPRSMASHALSVLTIASAVE